MKFCAIILSIILVIIVGCSNYSVPGKYTAQENAEEYIELFEDGTFTVKQEGILSGTYEVKGEHVFLKFKDGTAAIGRMEGQVLIDPDGVEWIKK